MTRIDTKHIAVLDGLRALAVLTVCWYHIWQQSWLPPYITGGLARLFGRSVISLDCIPRSGYLFVDFMLLLSAFLLFLPYAREMDGGEKTPQFYRFYLKRLIRIVPSYVFIVLVIFFCYAYPSGAFSSVKDALTELSRVLTFRQMFYPDTYLASRITGVLWTVCVELSFYLVFPFLAKLFQKQSLLTYAGLVLAALWFNRWLVLPNEDSIRFLLNQFPAFLGVFANGMLASLLYVRMAKRMEHGTALALAGTIGFLASCYLVGRILINAAESNHLQYHQLDCRFLLSLAFGGVLFFSTISCRGLRFVLGSRPLRFLAGISYNLYLWHQWLSVRLKEWRIPYWAGDTPPNFTGDSVWQKQYTLLCFGAGLLAAILATYLIERPVASFLTKRIPCLTSAMDKTVTSRSDDILSANENDTEQGGQNDGTV